MRSQSGPAADRLLRHSNNGIPVPLGGYAASNLLSSTWYLKTGVGLTENAHFLTHFMADMPNILAESSKNLTLLRGTHVETAREKDSPYYVARLESKGPANPHHFAVADGHRGAVKAPPCRALTSRKSTR